MIQCQIDPLGIPITDIILYWLKINLKTLHANFFRLVFPMPH